MISRPIIIAGPTASGKTDAALELAKIIKADIISADSRQVYKMLNAGTAAPAGAWQRGVFKVGGISYHLVDFLDINDNFDVSKFSESAARIIANAPDKQYIFAGGTGMYLQGFFSGMDELPQANQSIRAELKKHSKEELHARLKDIDPQSAAQIPQGNIQRVMRALEIFMLTGKPASQLRTGKFAAQIPPEKARIFYLNWDKEILNARIEERTKQIFAPMVEEAKAALAAGYAPDAPGLKSLGYREALAYLKGDITRAAATERVTILTRQYAKRQRTWFARYKDMTRINLQRPTFNAKYAAEIILKL